MRSDRHTFAVVLARFISRTGGEAAFFVGIWGKAAFTFDATPTDLALLMAALGVTSLAGSAVAGMLIDRHGPKRVLVFSELLFAPATIAAAYSADMGQLTWAVAAIGLFGAPAYTAIASLGPYLTDDNDRLAKINAWIETAGMAALISGTAIGALLASQVSIDAIFWFDGITSLLAVAVVWPLKIRSMAGSEHVTGSLAEIRAGFVFVFTHDRLRFYLFTATAIWLLFGLYGALEPLFYRDVLETGPETIGWVNTILGIGLVAGTVGIARLPSRHRTAMTVVGLLALNGLAGVLYVATSRLPVVAIGAVVWGIALGAYLPLVRTLIQLNSPEEMIGRVMGTTQVVGEVAKMLPLMAAPTVASIFGVQWALVGAALVLIMMAAGAAPTGRRLDRTRTLAVPRPGQIPEPTLTETRSPHA